MEPSADFYQWIDPLLIFFFRIGPIPILGYYLGCAVLGLICVVLGQLTIAIAFSVNRRFIDRDNREMVRMHNTSVKALMAKDKTAYKNSNKAANDAFGKVFFSQIALSVSGLWPLPFAMGWMQTRFLDVQFPLPFTLPWIGDRVGFLFTFLPIYILMFILFGKIKRKLPFFRTVARSLDHYEEEEGEQMIRISDLVAPSSSDRTSSL
jgi:hypothetical protein